MTEDNHSNINNNLKVGLALGGGGVRGGAHIGVLKVLEEYGIKIDLIAGTSAGSAVAALYAYGYKAQQIEEIYAKTDVIDLLKWRPTKKGLVNPSGYSKILSQYTDNGKIEDAKIPLYIVTTDLISRKQVIFNSGDIVTAVTASSAIPGMMPPVRHNGMLLSDGGILNNCPCDVLRNNGADIILAVNLSCIANYEPKNTVDIVFRAMDIITDHSEQSVHADWIISPIDVPVGILERHMIEKSMRMGEKNARRNIDSLLSLLQENGLR